VSFCSFQMLMKVVRSFSFSGSGSGSHNRYFSYYGSYKFEILTSRSRFLLFKAYDLFSFIIPSLSKYLSYSLTSTKHKRLMTYPFLKESFLFLLPSLLLFNSPLFIFNSPLLIFLVLSLFIKFLLNTLLFLKFLYALLMKGNYTLFFFYLLLSLLGFLRRHFLFSNYFILLFIIINLG